MSQLLEFMSTYKAEEACGWMMNADGEYVYGHAVPDARPDTELPPIDECGLAVSGVAVERHYDSLAIAQTLRASHQQLLAI